MLCVAEAITGIPSDRRPLAVAQSTCATCSESSRPARLLQASLSAHRRPGVADERLRLHPTFAPDGTPRAITVASPKRDERDAALELLTRTRRGGGTLIGDKG
jgi:hypothetical protein